MRFEVEGMIRRLGIELVSRERGGREERLITIYRCQIYTSSKIILPTRYEVSEEEDTTATVNGPTGPNWSDFCFSYMWGIGASLGLEGRLIVPMTDKIAPLQ
jgi:hypothetical protein